MIRSCRCGQNPELNPCRFRGISIEKALKENMMYNNCILLRIIFDRDPGVTLSDPRDWFTHMKGKVSNRKENNEETIIVAAAFGFTCFR